MDRWYNPGMFRHLLLLSALLGVAFTAVNPLAAADMERLGKVDKIFMWPMSNSLDQFLAEQVTTEGVFDVVIDPKRAQAILTDRVSSKFLEGMEELFPSPEEIAEAKKGAEEDANDAAAALAGAYRPERSPIHSSSRARGAVFLVDITSREVLWSTFLEDDDTTAKAMHKQAQLIVRRLKKQLATTAQ